MAKKNNETQTEDVKAVEAVEPTKAKRKSVCNKFYTLENNDKVKHAQPGIVNLDFKFNSGEVITVDLNEIPDNIKSILAWHGLSQKLGDAYAGAEKSTSTPEDLLRGVLEQLVAGDWVRKGEGTGPRVSLITEAVVRAKVAAGVDFATIDQGALSERLKVKKLRDRAMATPQVAAEYENIKAERATERARKLGELAAADTGEGLLDL